MSINNSYLEMLDYESKTTKKFLELYPVDKGDYKPHEKNMELKRLTGHIVELVDWVGITLLQDELDWNSMNYVPTIAENAEQILAIHEEKTNKAIEVLKNCGDEMFHTSWTMRKGEHIFFTMPKIAVLRNFVFNHITHHRAQLGMYYRLLDVKVPMSYGPTADFGM
ncbi:MAG: DinB family protein [Ferruginibacter sp.]|nr:DinB family protein [Ferruginibacter sp.]